MRKEDWEVVDQSIREREAEGKYSHEVVVRGERLKPSKVQKQRQHYRRLNTLLPNQQGMTFEPVSQSITN